MEREGATGKRRGFSRKLIIPVRERFKSCWKDWRKEKTVKTAGEGAQCAMTQ